MKRGVRGDCPISPSVCEHQSDAPCVCVCVCDQGSSLSFPGLFSCCQLKVSELECELRVPFAVVVYSVGLLLLISVLHVTTLWRE